MLRHRAARHGNLADDQALPYQKSEGKLGLKIIEQGLLFYVRLLFADSVILAVLDCQPAKFMEIIFYSKVERRPRNCHRRATSKAPQKFQNNRHFLRIRVHRHRNLVNDCLNQVFWLFS